MDNIRLCQISSLEKVYLDYVFPDTEYTSMSAMKNERTFRFNNRYRYFRCP